MHRQLDAQIKRVSKQSEGVVNQRIQQKKLTLSAGTLPHGKNALVELGRLFDGILDGAQRGEQGGIARPVNTKHFQPKHHRRKQVIELMGHAGGKLAQRFYFLRLANLFLQVIALGDILAVRGDSHDLAVIVHQRGVIPFAQD